MVRRTVVLPPTAGQADGVITICASVTAGVKVEVALRTAARAAAGSFCRAIVRTPSRAAAESWPFTWKAWPNSTMPSTSAMSSGTISANSTALAPRSSRSRRRDTEDLLPSWMRARRSGPRGTGRCAAKTCAGSGQGVGDVLEQAVELVAEDQHGADDDSGDQAHHQAVLDGGGALLLALQALLGEGHERDQGGVRVHHGVAPGGVRRPGRAGVARRRGLDRESGGNRPD